MTGPYEREEDTFREPLHVAHRRLHDSWPGSWRTLPGGGRQHIGEAARDLALDHLLAACQNAGVELGDFDRRTLTWLAGGEVSTVQVLIGLIARAHAAGAVAGSEGGAR